MFNNFEEPYTVEAHVSRVSTEDLAHAIETMPAHAVGSPLHLAAVAELAARTAPVEPAPTDDDYECEGHESLSGAHMGESVFCDGTCR